MRLMIGMGRVSGCLAVSLAGLPSGMIYSIIGLFFPPVVTLGFFPDGYRYSEPWPQDLIKTFEGTTLGYLLASAEDLECSITSNCECRESDSVKFLDTHGYSIAIENPNYLALIRHPWRLTIAVQTLRSIMWCARFIIPVHRFLKRG